MDMTRNFWEENGGIQTMKYESCNPSEEMGRLKEERGVYPCCDTNLNFSTATCSEDDCEYGPYKKNKVARQDPMSHRIIEKRRRDRMNNCLADLSRLIPTEYLKKGRGRIEKTEIIEMAIKHMKYLQQEQGNVIEHYRLGYQECMSEAMRFMVEVEGHFPREAICVRLLDHLQKHCESISRATHVPANTSTSETNKISATAHHEPVIQNGNSTNNNHIQIKICDYQIRKTETDIVNGNNSNRFAMTPPPNMPSSESDYEKQSEGNNVSYKYKTNIKLRFNQDINSLEDAKRQKTEKSRRNSITNSIENHSHSSPPSSELCTRISDSENMSQQTTSETSSINNQLKLETPRNDMLQRFSPCLQSQIQNNVKENFNVPIFVLHAKGSYYVPLTIDYKTLLPFLHNYDLLESESTMHNIVLHPVTINVNFLPNFNSENKYKAEYNNNWH